MRNFLVSLFVCLGIAGVAIAQTDSSSLRVLVADSSDSAIGSATVKLVNSQTGASFERQTDGDGYATFSPISRGIYAVTATKTGFQTKTVSDITLRIDERLLLKVDLAVASLAEAIEVTAAVASIQTEQASLGQVITGKTAVELPLNGRRYTELALLSPGVTASTLNPQTRGPGWFVANGNYHTQNNFLLDGVDNNQGTTNAQSLSAQVVQPSPDSLSEFKVQTNSYSAEFGRSAGAVINVSLKSGSNDVHGSGWYFNRDSSLSANRWQSNLIGAPKDVLRWHQFGGTVGGPIIKNKLFYFGAYEGFRRSFSESGILAVPTAGQRLGQFAFDVRDPLTNQPFANRQIPSTRFDTLGKRLIDLYPQPNLPGRTVAGGRVVENFGVQLPGEEDTHKYDVRTDYNADDRNQIMARLSYLRQDIFRTPIFEGIADGVGNQGTQFNKNYSGAMAWTRILSETMINTFRFGINYTFSEFAHATANGQRADEFGFRGFPAEMLQVGGLPLIDTSNYNPLGTRNFRPQFQAPWTLQFTDTFSVVRGRHNVRAGFDFRFKKNDFVDVTRRTPAYALDGRFTGDTMGDLLLGSPWRLQLNTVPAIDQRQNVWAAFFQDDFKLMPTLTLNLGLRYEYATPYWGAGANPNINFDPSTRQLIRGDGDDRYLITPDRNNFAPRIGLAWQAVPGRVVGRAAYGIFYSAEDFYGSEANLPLNPLSFVQVGLIQQGINQPPPILLSDPVPTDILTRFNTQNLALRTRERDNRAALIQQWNFAVEFTVTSDSTFEVAYVGNRGRNLLALWERNQTAFGVDGSVPANRPFPEWQGIQTGATRARSWYNALQLKYDKRFAKGWYTLFSYTYASALDEGGAWDAGNSPQVLDVFSAERGPQSQTPRQRLTMAGIWELPFGKGKQIGANWNAFTNAVLGGWQLSTIVTARTGLPVNVGLNGTGINPRTGLPYQFLGRNGGALRPNRIGNPNTGIDPKEDRFRFLDVNAYEIQPINTPGNSSRNSAWGPRLWQFDTSLVKRFGLTDRIGIDFRAEAYNLFNTVNFGNPNGGYGGTSFGQISSAGDPRIMQLALRVAF
jgi:hypothetical protein